MPSKNDKISTSYMDEQAFESIRRCHSKALNPAEVKKGKAQ